MLNENLILKTLREIEQEGEKIGLKKGLKKGKKKGDHNQIVRIILRNHSKYSVPEIMEILGVCECFVKNVVSGKIKEIN